jgi:thiol-disulfide isomerase/thioredoxin
MLRKLLFAAAGIVAILIATGSFLYLGNATPTVPAISDADAAVAGRPWVVKLHAQWCPVCMLTKGVWSEIEHAYAGRVRFVVFDYTDEATTAASSAEAERLGLGDFFAAAGVATGTIVVLDGRTKAERAWINGSRDVADYAAEIDAALAASRD